MPVPGVELFSFPVTSVPITQPTNTRSFDFLFPAVPSGMTWTGSFLPCIPQQILPLPVPLDPMPTLNNVTWLLTRNGQPELTWTGDTILRDVQAGPGDRLMVTAYNLPDFPVSVVTVTWKGYAIDTSRSWPVTMWLSNSGSGGAPPANPDTRIASANWVSTTSAASGSSLIISSGGGPTLSLLEAQLSYSVACASGSANSASGLIYITDTVAGATIAQLPIVCKPGQAVSDSVTLDCHGYVPQANAGGTTSVYLQWSAGALQADNSVILGILQYLVIF